MAVFMVNTCKFRNCRLTFSTLESLIYHIEYAHIDHDPVSNMQREASHPESVPLSYVARFTSEQALHRYQSTMAESRPQSTSEPSSGDTQSISGSEYEEESEVATDSEDSNDSWTTLEEYSSEFILKYGTKMAGTDGEDNRPFACPVPGCRKRYKNVNGIKYHSKNGHKKEGRIKKDFKCYCGKSYKSATGLKTHSNNTHCANHEAPVVVTPVPVRPATASNSRPASGAVMYPGRPFNLVLQVLKQDSEPPAKRRRESAPVSMHVRHATPQLSQ